MNESMEKRELEEVEFWKERLFVTSASYSLFKPILESRLSLFLYE